MFVKSTTRAYLYQTAQTIVNLISMTIAATTTPNVTMETVAHKTRASAIDVYSTQPLSKEPHATMVMDVWWKRLAAMANAKDCLDP